MVSLAYGEAAVPMPLSIIVATNNENLLTGTLLSSPALRGSGCQVIRKQGFSSAAAAYNSGLQEANHEILVFVHQDVYLPAAWTRDLSIALSYLTDYDPLWGVLGVFGVRRGVAERTGFCYSTGLQRVLGQPFHAPLTAQSLDELLLVVRKSACLSFDPQLPGFHLYGTDLCLQAEQRGMNNYIIPAFCIHNSNGLQYYPAAYWESYRYMRSKWWPRLPVYTSCTTLTRSPFSMLRQIASDVRRRAVGTTRGGSRHNDPGELYRQLCEQSQIPSLLVS